MKTIADNLVGSVSLKCDCGTEMAVFEKWDYGDQTLEYTLSFQSALISENQNSLWQRIKNAWKILTKKPVYYAEVCCESADKMKVFLQEALTICNK